MREPHAKRLPCNIPGLLSAVVLLLCLTGADGSEAGALEPASLFTDHAVLQQGMPVPVWGWAEPGAEVRVSFAGRNVKVKTAPDGRWLIRLPSLPASAKGGVLKIASGKDMVERRDVLVGEVWLASGQSNMEMPVAPSGRAYPGVIDWEKEAAAADHPNLRMFTVAKTVSQTPQSSCGGSWELCSPQTVGAWSAAGYFFGRDLSSRLNVPVGIIHTSWPGSGSAAWVRLGALEADPFLQGMLAQWKDWTDRYPARKAEYDGKMAAWEAARKEGKDPGTRPSVPVGDPDSHQRPANLWCGMVAPLLPYAARGVIWYQGETPGMGSYTHTYETVLRNQIADWRRQFELPDLAFLIVGLTNWRKPLEEPADAVVPWGAEWAWIRDGQKRVAQTTPLCGMIVGTDIGREDELHPRRKQEVGRRLELAAAALAYGRKIEWSGPWYRTYRVEGNEIRIFFDHQGGGLKSLDGAPLARFAVCGADRKFVWAQARVETAAQSGLKEDTVVVGAKSVTDPVAVRYAFETNPLGANLGNTVGLPAAPFRTDEWMTEAEERHRARMAAETEHKPAK